MQNFKFKNTTNNKYITEKEFSVIAKTYAEAERRIANFQDVETYALIDVEEYGERFDAVKRTGKNDIVTTNQHYTRYAITAQYFTPRRRG